MVDICAPTNGRPVEGSVGVLDQRRWEGAIRLVEAVQHRQRAGCRHFEDRPTATGESGAIPAPARCPVEVSIAGLDQWCDGIGAVRVVEAVQRGQRACRGHFEDRATSARARRALDTLQIGRCCVGRKPASRLTGARVFARRSTDKGWLFDGHD